MKDLFGRLTKAPPGCRIDSPDIKFPLLGQNSHCKHSKLSISIHEIPAAHGRTHRGEGASNAPFNPGHLLLEQLPGRQLLLFGLSLTTSSFWPLRQPSGPSSHLSANWNERPGQPVRGETSFRISLVPANFELQYEEALQSPRCPCSSAGPRHLRYCSVHHLCCRCLPDSSYSLVRRPCCRLRMDCPAYRRRSERSTGYHL